MAAPLGAFGKGRDIDTCPCFVPIFVDARNRNVTQNDFSIGKLPQVFYSIVESRQRHTAGNPAEQGVQGQA